MHTLSPLLPIREQSLPLLDTAALRRLEQGSPPGLLMERAGLAVARLARALWPQARRVSLICGPGNNGGDGYVAARHLQSRGLSVQVLQVGRPQRPSSERQLAEATAAALGLRAVPLKELDPGADVLIDALLGLGLRSAPEGELLAAIEAMNLHPAPKLGVDLPSGLQADTGHAPGAVVHCTHTLSLMAPTPGLLTGEGRQQTGRIWLDRLGCATDDSACALAGSPREEWRLHSARAHSPHSSHKGSAGRVWVLQGEAGMAGAARLAARAALAAGAGRVYLSGEAVDADPLWPELMRPSSAQALADVPGGVGVVGCGGGSEVAAQLLAWLQAAGQLVLDADALNALSDSASLQQALQERAARSQHSVITPHPLEAARLLGCSTALVQADRLAAAQQLADRFRCTVVLKGSGSVIAAPGVLPRINTSGHAALGTAGTGDVLAGWLAGLLAQAPAAPVQELAAIACAWQGEAADRLPEGGGPLRASELIAAMAALQR
jgi:hydroxyethylthiazole kinase-like uncharacterized protein yjeF